MVDLRIYRKRFEETLQFLIYFRAPAANTRTS